MAQPVVTPDTRNVLGEELPIKFYAEFTGTAGPAGADQTWDFSLLEGITPSSVFDWIPENVENTAYQDSFPEANLAIQVPPELIGRDSAEAYFYYDVAADGKLQYYGYAASIPDSSFAGERDTFFIIYDDPALDAAFPITYEEVFEDEWTQIIRFASDSLSFSQYRSAERTLTADGYGTLITPAGTFDNALRVRRDEIVRDSTVFPGSPFPLPAQVSQRNTYWDWYAPGETYLLMQITNTRLLTSGIEVLNTTSAFFRDRGPATDATAFRSPEAIALTAYPNPASEQLKMDFTLPAAAEVVTQIVSVQGQLVRQLPPRHFGAGAGSFELPLRGLAPGTYFALLLFSDGATRVPFVIAR